MPRGAEWVTLGDEVVAAYVDEVVRLSLVADRDVRLAYTPLHGVGRDTLRRVLARAGFAAPAVVAEQAEPDPAFPTVEVPNPEEPGAVDRLLALADATGADVGLANDPDADRLAVVAGGRLLRGDEVGALLAEHVLTHTSGPDRLVVTTVVSSSLLSRIAATHGVRYAETLTGFKWIVRAGGPGDRFVFGYEEALGYCIGGWSGDGPPVRDKDGIAAALSVAELVASLRRAGRTVDDALDDLARRHGLHLTDQWSLRLARPGQAATAIATLRADPPVDLAGHRVTAVEDLASGHGGLPATDALRLRVGDRARVVIRASGTEPKLKAYLEVVTPVTETVARARALAGADLGALRDAVAATVAATLPAGTVPTRDPRRP
ncbi:MAG TPA: hypothetical protein VKP64_09695 [Mycobacteriales bacterium]|nr:hypothetical protein [Mycobacteriales bacterium]